MACRKGETEHRRGGGPGVHKGAASTENEAEAGVVAEAAITEAAADATALDLPDTDDDNREMPETHAQTSSQIQKKNSFTVSSHFSFLKASILHLQNLYLTIIFFSPRVVLRFCFFLSSFSLFRSTDMIPAVCLDIQKLTRNIY